MQVLFYTYVCFFSVLILWAFKYTIGETCLGNKIIAVLSFKQAYILEDFQGQLYYTRSSRMNNVPVYPESNVGNVRLLIDGTTAGNSNYIRTWERY